MQTLETKYQLTPSGKMVMDSTSQLTVICGAVGSGKSTAAMLSIIKRASEQPLYNGVRRSRVCFIRNHVPVLRTTTIETFKQIFPEAKLKYNYPINGILEFTNENGEHVRIELLFLPVSTKEDTQRLRSLELTYAFINEANKVSYDVLSACMDRVGRYPPKNAGGIAHSGVILDTNAFSSEHWLRQFVFKDFETFTAPTGDYVLTDDMLAIRQPPAVIQFGTKKAAEDYVNTLPDTILDDIYPHTMDVVKSINGFYFVNNPYCDNLTNLPKNYYIRSIGSKPSQDVNVNYMSHFVHDTYSDTACFPMFNTELHVTEELADHKKATLIVLGWDFGLTPACCVNLVFNDGKVATIAECFQENMGLERFVPYVIDMLHDLGIEISATISFMDVAGQQRAQSNESTCLSVLQSHKFAVGATVTQNIMSRLEAVRNLLYEPEKYTIHRNCDMLINGLLGEYKFSDNMAEKGILKPDKNRFSHLADALQYAFLGMLTLNDSITDLDDF
jgi:phage terminase large subunit